MVSLAKGEHRNYFQLIFGYLGNHSLTGRKPSRVLVGRRRPQVVLSESFSSGPGKREQEIEYRTEQMGTTLDEGVGEGGAVAEGRWLTFPCSLIVRGDVGCQKGSELLEAFQAAKPTESSCPPNSFWAFQIF